MPEYLAPGVYVEETTFRSRSIEGVPTSTTGIVGLTRYGPVAHVVRIPGDGGGDPVSLDPVVSTPPLITSFSEFERAFGGLGRLNGDPNYTAMAARAFFDNGGRRLYVSRSFAFPEGQPNDQFFGTRPVGAVAQWRARWPGAAAEGFEVAVRLRRGKNAIAPTPNGLRLRGVREHVLVELAPLDAEPIKDDTPPVEDQIRVVVRDPVDGNFKLAAADGGVQALSGDQAAFPLQLDVEVRWADRVDAYTELAVHPEHPRSIFRVLEAEHPADEFGLVWLRRLGEPTPQQVIAALLAPDNSGFLVGGQDLTDFSGEILTGQESDPDDDDLPVTGLGALREIEDIAIVLAPDTTRIDDLDDQHLAVSMLLEHAEEMRYRIAVVDPPADQSISQVRAFRAQHDSKYGALYYPWLEIIDPSTRPEPGAPSPRIFVPPSGALAGIYGRNDVERGVFKAPANEVVRGIIGFRTNVTFSRQQVLNPEGINALRFFEGRSNRVWGARTLSSDPEWKYVNVRRLFLFLERSIDLATQFAVFEPNNQRLWSSIRQSIEDFLIVQWRSGALMGTRPEEAFFVRCDRTTMSQNDLDNGRLICLIGVAPTYPAEFVIFRIGQWTADARSS